MAVKVNAEKLSRMLGLSARARMLSAGTDIACDSVRGGSAKILMVAYDASANTKKRAFNCAKFYETACYEIPIGQNDLGKYVGKKGAVSVISLNDRNMAKGIIKLLDEMSEADKNPREV
ncbi:MAG: ribosomal L7Ae/L30e/S12e/Gadd45 family protein [Clostridia bacterium]|nr:ribosomal L7Ae/L30e/S12e/Gadd45 family protein [Clostridia bacterium]